MKEKNILEISVGLFVLLTVAAFLMLALQVSGMGNFYEGEDTYRVKAYFTNIGGLKVKSKVTLGGVRIGRVVNIGLEAKEQEYYAVVEMAIEKRINKLPTDSNAKILTAGLLGDNYISIELGSADTYLKEDDSIRLTSQAILLEDLISKFAVNK
jgi:phospholipid/cholesterol/gamma-HCH transport system substrate-binding protein